MDLVPVGCNLHFDSVIQCFKMLFAAVDGVQNLHPHKLRHSFASIAITNGADIASVSEKLGHTDKAVTLRMYTHADQESIRRAIYTVFCRTSAITSHS